MTTLMTMAADLAPAYASQAMPRPNDDRLPVPHAARLPRGAEPLRPATDGVAYRKREQASRRGSLVARSKYELEGTA